MEENNAVVTSNEPLPSPSSVLVFGILSLALCESVILGLIFGFIAKSKGKKFINAGGALPGQVKVGRTLGLIGIILSFLMIVFWIVYFVVIAAVLNQAGVY